MDVFGDVLDRQDRGDKADDSTASDDVQLMMEAEEPEALSLTLDVNGQYQFRADNGPGAVTYRVVQVTQDDDGQAQLIGGLSSNQAILHGMTNGDRLTEDTSLGEARLAYIPAVAGLETRQGIETVVSSSSISPSSGPFYVMMAPTEVLQTTQQRVIMPRLATPAKADGEGRASRDDRRRATHNEVERRRRDKINCWILQLGKLVPEFTTADQAKQGDSKSVILSKACDYISELQTAQKEMADRLKDADRIKNEVDLLQRSCEELKQENELLRAHLHDRGITDDQMNDLPL